MPAAAMDGSDLLKLGTAFKIYARALELICISTAGRVYDFFAAHKAWEHLTQDVPAHLNHQTRLLASVFSGTALSRFERIASANPQCCAEELRVLARSQLSKSSHERQMQRRFNKKVWKEGSEGHNQFSHRVRETALALPELGSDDTFLDRFIQSLSPAIQYLAVSVSGSFDKVSGRVAMMSASAVFETGRGDFPASVSEKCMKE